MAQRTHPQLHLRDAISQCNLVSSVQPIVDSVVGQVHPTRTTYVRAILFESTDPNFQCLLFSLFKLLLWNEVSHQTWQREFEYEPCTPPSNLGRVQRRECVVRSKRLRVVVHVRRPLLVIRERPSKGMRHRLRRSLYLNDKGWIIIGLSGW
jgi:hypothetical protein